MLKGGELKQSFGPKYSLGRYEAVDILTVRGRKSSVYILQTLQFHLFRL